MRKYLLLLPLTFVLFFQTACNKNEDPVLVNPPKLIIDIQKQYETPPSRVSVFFSVKDEDGAPVAGLTPDNFTIYERGRNDDAPKLISEDEADRIIGDNQQVFDYKVLLLLDLSGSVINNSLTTLKEAAREFVIDVMQADVNSSTEIGIWWFDGADFIHSLVDFTSNSVELQEAILGINPGMSFDNSTDLFGAIIKATDLAQAEMSTSTLQGSLSAASVIVFTDGTDQAARHSKEEAYEKVDNAPENISYYTIGMGSEIDEDVLRKIGTDSFVFAEDSANLTAKFEEIAQVIHDESNSFYLFEYCTPKRHGSGINDLIIKVEDTENRAGEKATNFDAEGFESGCNLN